MVVVVVVVVVVVAATPNYLRQASQNLGKYQYRYMLVPNTNTSTYLVWGRTDKNLCRCFGVPPGLPVFP